MRIYEFETTRAILNYEVWDGSSGFEHLDMTISGDVWDALTEREKKKFVAGCQALIAARTNRQVEFVKINFVDEYGKPLAKSGIFTSSVTIR